jgi:uncharacterized membrane protein
MSQTEDSENKAAARVRKAELLISNILRIGLATSLVIIVSGTLLSFVHHPDYVSAPSELQRLTQPGAAFPHTIAEVVDGVANLRGQAIVVIGLLVLLATPVARVAVSIFAFMYQRDRVFVALTAAVLFLLLLSFVLGRVEG